MPLDNRERRASAVSLNPGAPPSPTPNAAMDQEWRQESGWGYAAILIGEAVPPPPPPVPPVVRRTARVRVRDSGIDLIPPPIEKPWEHPWEEEDEEIIITTR